MEIKVRFAISQIPLWLRVARSARTPAELRMAIEQAREWSVELQALRAAHGS